MFYQLNVSKRPKTPKNGEQNNFVVALNSTIDSFYHAKIKKHKLTPLARVLMSIHLNLAAELSLHNELEEPNTALHLGLV